MSAFREFFRLGWGGIGLMHPTPEPTGPGEESVWNYPRPPRLEPVQQRIEIDFAGETIASTDGAFRVLETSHPPGYYLPHAAFRDGVLRSSSGGSFCEWKGRAVYFDVVLGDHVADRVAWSYPDPTPRFEPIKNFIAVYAGPMDACRVGEYTVTPQPGGFYGGWITPNIRGPFKGTPGTGHW